MDDRTRLITASREIDAPAGQLFELIADPAEQPRWDGNDNLDSAAGGQRVRAVGDVFRTTLTEGSVRENHVILFEEGRAIAWRPAPEGERPPGHVWAWRLEPLPDGRTRVEHSYDWSDLQDPSRLERARGTTEENLRASIDRLAELAEGRGRS